MQQKLKATNINLSYNLIRVIESPYYTEGPVLDGLGNLFFTTITGSKIMRMTPDGRVEAWAHCGWPNGQRILACGDHLICDSRNGEVVRLNPQGEKLRVEAGGSIGSHKIRVPNDLAIDEGNGFYFTDSVRHDGVVFYKGFDGTERIIAKDIDLS